MGHKKIDDKLLDQVIARSERALQDGTRITGSYSATYVCTIADGAMKLVEEVLIYRQWEEILRNLLEMKKGVLKTQEEMFIHMVENDIWHNRSSTENLIRTLRLEVVNMEVMINELDILGGR